MDFGYYDDGHLPHRRPCDRGKEPRNHRNLGQSTDDPVQMGRGIRQTGFGDPLSSRPQQPRVRADRIHRQGRNEMGTRPDHGMTSLCKAETPHTETCRGVSNFLFKVTQLFYNQTLPIFQRCQRNFFRKAFRRQ